MDIDEMRGMEIRLHGLRRADHTYTLFYDETNNIRRLHVTDGGLNFKDPGCFVLAGVASIGSAGPIEIKPLRDRLRLQPTVGEFKLEHIARGDFLALLGSPKLDTVLSWIGENGLFIHFQVLDVLYWSIVDIIDSILADAKLPLSHYDVNAFKDAVYAALREDIDAAVGLFFKFKYPGLRSEDAPAFLHALEMVIRAQIGKLSEEQQSDLRFLLAVGLEAQSLPFIEDNEANVLIDAFDGFYWHRAYLLVNSTHIMDDEPRVKAQLANRPMRFKGKDVQNYRFADSKSEPLIQVSDVVAGFLGKYYSYLTRTSLETLVADRKGLSPDQERTLGLLRDLVDASHDENPVFIHRVLSLTDQWKNDFFLHDVPL